jgi:Flp pilus assembly protein TadG
VSQPHQPSNRSGENGSISIWVIMLALVVTIMVGLVVDGSAIIHTYQQANSISREAARIAGQQVSFEDSTDQVGNSQEAAMAAAREHLARSGCTNHSITITTRIEVTCDLTHDFIIFPGHRTLTGQGSAEAIHVT